MRQATMSMAFSVILILTISVCAIAGPVPDTGQTQSYANTFGDDADYNINPPSYTKLDAHGNELSDDAASWVMVKDNVTGLIWEVKTNDGSIHDKYNEYPWYTAKDTFISQLNSENFGGYSDWRIPTIKELSSIINLGRYNPAINTTYFPNTLSSYYYWSSTTTSANGTSYAWLIDFNYGSNGHSYKSSSYCVRAVRGGQSRLLDNLVINGDSTVTDTTTGLMWQQASDGTMNWESAISHCEALSLAGYSDWRLPNREELRSIVDYSKYNPAVDTTYFPDTLSSYCWSSTTSANSTSYAWYIHFDYGHDNSHDKSYSYYVRAVRGGQYWLFGHSVISAPAQGSHWDIGSLMPIRWDTKDIGGNVKISISCDGGKSGTFDTIVESAENNGVYEWTVTGSVSSNCVLKIEPLSEPDKGTTQGLFSLDLQLSGTVTDSSTNLPIANVTVSTNYDQNTQTNAQGVYSFFNILDVGIYDITFTKNDYQTVTISDIVIQISSKLDVPLPTEGHLNITREELLPGNVGKAYNDRVWVAGGTAPYTFSLAYGSLPGGLSLDPEYGYITGTPTTPGTYTFRIGATDHQSGYAEAEYTIEVTQPLKFTTASPMPRATRSQFYFGNIEAIGGTQPYTFSKLSGNIPNGLTLSSDGQLAGTPTTTGDNTFTVRVTDASGRITDKSYILAVDATLSITTQNLTTANTGKSYTHTLQAAGGYGDYTWNIYSSALPQGITLDSAAGVLSGTPQTASTTPLVFMVEDAIGRKAFKNLALMVTAPLAFATTSLPTGAVDQAYSELVRVCGGLPPHTFSYTGLLPDGLSLGHGCFTETFDSVNMSSQWIKEGNAYPFITDDQRLRFGDINNGQSSSISITLTVGQNASVGFDYQVSSESGYDYLRFLVDNMEKNKWSGSQSAHYTCEVPQGTHTFLWKYQKDSSQYGGSDTAWLDNISIGGCNVAGVISGIPTAAKLTNFEITVQDSSIPAPQEATATLSLRVTSMLTITSSAVLPSARLDQTISTVVLGAVSGSSPYQWSIVGGMLPSGITLDGSTGQLSGTPIEAGDYVFTVRVTDNNSTTADKEFIYHVARTLTIDTNAVPDGGKDTFYSYAAQVSGGRLPYTWRVSNGSLPAGLSLDQATGAIAGMPTTGQSAQFTLEVSDNDCPAQTAQKTFSINIHDELFITTETLPNARLGQAYTTTISAALGTPPYVYTVSEGILPAGLSMTSGALTATISGTPAESNRVTFTIEVNDNGVPAQTVSRQYTVNVYSLINITTTGLSNAFKGENYNQTIAVTDGHPPYTWSVISGQIPAGLSLNSASGQITGITSWNPGMSAEFTLQVTDSGQPAAPAEQQFTIYVIEPVEITTNTIQCALQKAEYSATIEGHGRLSPLAWTISNGTLPNGLSLNSTTGTISGTPIECGEFDFTIRLSDSSPTPLTADKAFHLSVNCCIDYTISGMVTMQNNTGSVGIEGVTLTLSGQSEGQTTTDQNGFYLFEHLPNGVYVITPQKPVYAFAQGSKTVEIANMDAAADFEIYKLWGDLNGDSKLDLADAVIALKIMSGVTPGGSVYAEGSINGKIGLDDAVYILRRIAEVD